MTNGLYTDSDPMLFKQLPHISPKLGAGGRRPAESWHVTAWDEQRCSPSSLALRLAWRS